MICPVKKGVYNEALNKWHVLRNKWSKYFVEKLSRISERLLRIRGRNRRDASHSRKGEAKNAKFYHYYLKKAVRQAHCKRRPSVAGRKSIVRLALCVSIASLPS